jgi:hypothetical protein
MPAWLYWGINVGLFDRFKSSNAPTQKGLTPKELCDSETRSSGMWCYTGPRAATVSAEPNGFKDRIANVCAWLKEQLAQTLAAFVISESSKKRKPQSF